MSMICFYLTKPRMGHCTAVVTIATTGLPSQFLYFYPCRVVWPPHGQGSPNEF